MFSSEEDGRLEKFRPYGLPSEEWLTWVKEHVVEVLFLLGQDEEHGTARGLFDVVNGCVVDRTFVDRRRQSLDHPSSGLRIPDLAASSTRGLAIGLGLDEGVGDDPWPIKRGHLADSGFHARIAGRGINDVPARVARTAQSPMCSGCALRIGGRPSGSH